MKLFRRTFLAVLVLTVASIYMYSTHVTKVPERTELFQNGRDMVITSGKKRNSLFNMTVVTAYFNIGTFKKGKHGNLSYTTETYKGWARTFGYLINPLVVYTDSEDFYTMMSKLRQKFKSITKVLLIKRTELWSFQVIEQIHNIYSQPNYPKYPPNTVIPEYSCVMHSKFAVVADAINKNYFPSWYTAWLDIGCFQNISSQKQYFQLVAPENLKDSKIAYSEVRPKQSLPVDTIITENMVWVGGAMFAGKTHTVLEYTEQYKRTALHLIDMKWISTDQQVIYAMFNHELMAVLKPEIELQVYPGYKKYDIWFALAYRCYRKINQTSISNWY